MNDTTDRTVAVVELARVEGEGGLLVKTRGGKVVEVQLRIDEPPRLFEAFLRGRSFEEAPDLTARVCGICPVAYQMSSVHAMEEVLGLRVEGALRELRRLLYCGEWIASHVLHVAMLHAPDFLGYESGIHMAKDHPELVALAMKLKKAGNEIVTIVGGREIHPVNVRVGGFHRVPTREELAPLEARLEWAQDAARELLRTVARFEFPDLERDYEFVALRHPDEYPFNEGRLVSSRGLDIPVGEFERHFREEQVPYSSALHSVRKGRGAYCVGPLARYNLNQDRLPASVRAAAAEAGLGPSERNPFRSILVRAVETLYAVEEARRIVAAYQPPERACVTGAVRAGEGHACTEAPRGILYHRYRIDAQGLIQEARIVPPTSQNQKTIEDDLRKFVSSRLHLAQEELTLGCERVVRSYDPCLSCATHFLRVRVERE